MPLSSARASPRSAAFTRCALPLPPLLEAGPELPPLHQLWGHDSVTTTLRSVHLTPKRVAAQGSPLESFPLATAPVA